MATISSPRPSISLSSRRTSASTDTITRTDPTLPTAQRRNRAALREFYNLKQSQAHAAPSYTAGASEDAASSADTLSILDPAPLHAMDRPEFDADIYAADVLSHEGLEGVLRIEAGLLKDIRGFDGERKALVYDNYSKLIGATETIRKMQGSMEPLRPTFATLTPAVAKIAEAAAKLSSAQGRSAEDDEAEVRRARERVVVQYALDTPQRLESLIKSGQREEADHDWELVSRTLDKWHGTEGVSELRARCEDAFNK